MVTRTFKATACFGAALMALAACATPHAGPSGLYAQPVVRAPVTANPTPYSPALTCLAAYARSYGLVSPRIAIGRIDDKTGRAEPDGSGRQITLGASEMAMSAFGKAGANLQERYDTSVLEMELKYSNNKLIGDVPGPPGQPNEHRPIFAAQVNGSDYYVVGAITEVNSNIYSSGGDILGAEGATTGMRARLGRRTLVMNVAMDLRVVHTISGDVVDILSYQKQIVAYEVGGGIFDFFNGNLIDVSVGTAALEPKQLAVRALIERATVEIMANFYGMPGPQACVTNDPLGGSLTAGVTGSYVPAYNNLGTNNAQTRDDPNRWNSRRGGLPAGGGRGY